MTLTALWRQIQSQMKAGRELSAPPRLAALEQFRRELTALCGEEPAIWMGLTTPVGSASDVGQVYLSDYIGYSLKARHAAVYGRKETEGFARLAGFGTAAPASIEGESPLPQWLLANQGPLMREKLTLAGLSAQEAAALLEELDRLNAGLVVPLLINDRLWGFFLIGQSHSGPIEEEAFLYLALFGMNLVTALGRRRLGLTTSAQAWANQEAKSLLEIQEIWRALKPSQGALRFFIFDEETETLRLLSGYFKRWGFEIAAASEEEEGIRALKRQRPHLALIDLSFRRCLPVRLLKAAGVWAPEAILLGTSALRNAAAEEEARLLGVHQIFQKPVMFARLARTVFEAALHLSLKAGPVDLPGRTRCLIVDDEGETTQALKDHFEAQGCRAWTAKNEETALRLISQTLPHLVLLDLKHPGGSEADWIGKIRKSSPASRVMVLSAWNREAPSAPPAAARADAYCIKPISVLQLTQLAEDLVLKAHPLAVQWADA